MMNKLVKYFVFSFPIIFVLSQYFDIRPFDLILFGLFCLGCLYLIINPFKGVK